MRKRARPAQTAADFEVRKVDGTREWLESTLAPLGDVVVRRMFGGQGIYSDDVMFGIVYRDRVYLKVDDSSRADFASQGMTTFAPRPGVELTSYYEVPSDILESEVDFVRWSRRALGIAQRAPKSRKPQSTPEDILRGHSSKVQKIAERLRRLVLELVPHASEAGYPGWKLIGYRAPHYFCFIAPMSDHVRLGFERGTELSDPERLLEGSGTRVRYVLLKTVRDCGRPEVRALITQASARPSPSKTRTPSRQRRR